MSINVQPTIILIFWLFIIPSSSSPELPPQVIAPHCPDKCGNISIPYPFGLQQGCYYENPHNNFKISCNHSFTPPKPFFGTKFAVFNTSLSTGEICINRDISYNCYDQTRFNRNYTALVNIRGYTISSTNNLLIGMGCDTFVWFTGVRHGKPYQTGCMTSCSDPGEVSSHDCNGVGCCSASLPDEVTNISATIGSFNNHSRVLSFNPCSVAYPVSKTKYKYHKENLSQDLGF